MQEKNSTNVHLASTLSILIEERGLDNTQVAQAINVTPTAIGNYRKGRVPRAEELFNLARFFGVSMESLLMGTAKPAKDDASWKMRALSAEQKIDALKTAVTSAVLDTLKKF
jgi:transcriptional regulator with XRE-family HTH domain